jgi:hypothetical protein
MKFCTALTATFFILLCFSFACSKAPESDVQETQKAQVTQVENVKEPVLTVLNPLGTPPPIKLKDMAPRLDTLKDKTIYIINDGYPGSDLLLGELKKVMEERYPDTKFVYRDKPGGFGREDEAIWKEMEKKADAMIIALGH